MTAYENILRSLGRIEGELVEIRKLSERVARLEKCQAWLKGAFLGAANAFLWKIAFGK
jgi:hypothetical protein